MKVAAHPMLVAVALGLLGPGALASEPSDDEDTCTRPSDADAAPADASDLDDVVDALEDEQAPYWTRLTLIDDPEQVDAWSEVAEDRDLTV